MPIEWSNLPPEPRDYARIKLIRVPCKNAIRARITSTEILGCWTHWDRWRTQPCPGDDCELCRKATPRRWHAYLGLVAQTTEQQVVVQLSACAAQDLTTEMARYGRLRGLLIELRRTAPRPNARIEVALTQDTHEQNHLPPEIDLKEFMTQIWSAKPNDEPQETQKND